MSRLFVLTIAVALAALALGCVPSENALYTEKELVAKPEFVGVWSSGATQAELRVAEGPDKSYILSMPPMGNMESTTTLKAHLVSLDGKMFMDAVNETDVSEDPALKAAHYFSKIDLQPESLSITLLNNDWMKGAVDSGKVKAAYEMKDEKVFLKAPTEELQKLVLECADDDAAFPNAIKFERVK